MMKLRSLMLSISLALAVCQAQNGKFAPDLNFQEIRQTMESRERTQNFGAPASTDETRIKVIIQYDSKSGRSARTRNARAVGRNRSSLDLIGADVVEVTAAELELLRNDPEVAYVSPDRELEGTLDIAMNVINYIPANDYANANLKPKGYGVAVAVLDSGINSAHKNLQNWNNTSVSRVLYSQSFIDASTADLQGHGTHVAGLIASTGNIAHFDNSQKLGLYAPSMDGNLVSLKVLDANGKSSDSVVISAINQAIALKGTYNIRVINLSLGRAIKESYKTDPLCQAVEKAWKAGIVVVVAAGNFGRDNSAGTKGYGTITSPANDPYVITVGAVNDHQYYLRDATLNVATYSSKGPSAIDHIIKPDLVAPGNRLISLQAPSATLELQYPGNRPLVSDITTNLTSAVSAEFFQLSGTSMAAPLVSGTAAFLISNDGTLTPDQVKSRMMKTAWRGFNKSVDVYADITKATYHVTHDIFTIGAGLLDASAAYFNTDRPTGSAASPMAVFNSTTKIAAINYNSTGAANVV